MRLFFYRNNFFGDLFGLSRTKCVTVILESVDEESLRQRLVIDKRLEEVTAA